MFYEFNIAICLLVALGLLMASPLMSWRISVGLAATAIGVSTVLTVPMIPQTIGGVLVIGVTTTIVAADILVSFRRTGDVLVGNLLTAFGASLIATTFLFVALEQGLPPFS